MSEVLTAPPAAPPVRPHVRAVRDGRPPSQTWVRHPAPRPDQPRLALELATDLDAAPSASRLGSEQRVHVVTHPWVAELVPNLPDPVRWSTSMAQAIVEVLHGRRPATQLSRWVSDPVLVTLNAGSQHRRRSAGPEVRRSMRPATLQSVHLQYPTSEAVEASAHLRFEARSMALAFRLEAWGQRWLCTALELGPSRP